VFIPTPLIHTTQTHRRTHTYLHRMCACSSQHLSYTQHRRTDAHTHTFTGCVHAHPNTSDTHNTDAQTHTHIPSQDVCMLIPTPLIHTTQPHRHTHIPKQDVCTYIPTLLIHTIHTRPHAAAVAGGGHLGSSRPGGTSGGLLDQSAPWRRSSMERGLRCVCVYVYVCMCIQNVLSWRTVCGEEQHGRLSCMCVYVCVCVCVCVCV